MEFLKEAIDFVLHIDEHLAVLIRDYGGWTNLILFAIIFCETGLVVTPILPGDSLLFAAGALSAQFPDDLNIWLLSTLLMIAAILGDTVNYFVGAYFSDRVLKIRFVKPEYLAKTHKFYEKYGGRTIVVARFVPIVRTFAPFVAGMGRMRYRTFLFYNIVGGIVWVAIFLFAGFFFGNIPVIKENFILVTIGIIVVSIVPILFELLRARKHRREQTA